MGDESEDVLPVHRYSPTNGRRDRDRTETWKMVGLIFTLVGLVFTAGYNWRRVDETAMAQEVLSKDVKENYVRRDVADQQMRNIDARLQEIRDLMQRLEEQRRRESAR